MTTVGVTFTLRNPGTYTPSSGFGAPDADTEIVGSAIQVRGLPEVYRSLGLVLTESPTLFFTPTTYGERPPIGASVTWQGEEFTVRSVDPIAPDGVMIAARVIITR